MSVRMCLLMRENFLLKGDIVRDRSEYSRLLFRAFLFCLPGRGTKDCRSIEIEVKAAR